MCVCFCVGVTCIVVVADVVERSDVKNTSLHYSLVVAEVLQVPQTFPVWLQHPRHKYKPHSVQFLRRRGWWGFWHPAQ